jgi:hypothetical protein
LTGTPINQELKRTYEEERSREARVKAKLGEAYLTREIEKSRALERFYRAAAVFESAGKPGLRGWKARHDAFRAVLAASADLQLLGVRDHEAALEKMRYKQ